MTPPIAVLDFDGVVATSASWRVAWPHERHPTYSEHKAACPHAFDRECVARVQRVCDATGAHVVVCSGWRRHFDAFEFATMLRDAGLTAPVLGVVGGLRMWAETRMDGIAEWLTEHDATRFVVIDDDVKHYLDFARYPDDTASEGWTETWVTQRGRQCRAFVPSWLVDRLVVPVDGLTEDNADAAIVALSIDRRVTR